VATDPVLAPDVFRPGPGATRGPSWHQGVDKGRIISSGVLLDPIGFTFAGSRTTAAWTGTRRYLMALDGEPER
jgi:hypothetical protein